MTIFPPIVGSSRRKRTQNPSNRRLPGNAAARRHFQQRATVSDRSTHLMTESDLESLPENENENSSSEAYSETTQGTEVLKRKIGTKKAQKLAEKKRRKEEREAEERYREALRKKEDEEIRKRKEAEAKEAAAEAAQVSLLGSFSGFYMYHNKKEYPRELVFVIAHLSNGCH